MKLVGLMPSNFNADDGRSYPGFRFYCTEENENAYGITTRSFWVKDAVYQDFIKEYFDGDPNRALGEKLWFRVILTVSRTGFYRIPCSSKCLAPEGVGCPASSYTCEVCEYWGKEDDT